MQRFINLKVDGLDRVIQFLLSKPSRVKRSIERTILQLSSYLLNYVRSKKLSGQVLNRRTGDLDASGNAYILVSGDKASAVIEFDSPYARIHEYGGTVTIREHLATSKLGNSFTVRSHTAVFPKRSYARTSLVENRSYIHDQLQISVNRSLGQI